MAQTKLHNTIPVSQSAARELLTLRPLPLSPLHQTEAELLHVVMRRTNDGDTTCQLGIKIFYFSTAVLTFFIHYLSPESLTLHFNELNASVLEARNEDSIDY